jgi:dUTP pyrophosphatase
MNNPNLLVQRTDADAKLPTKGSEQSAGWDIYCLESVDIPAGRRATLPTGIAFGIPAGWYGRIAPRSGLANKYGADILAGVVDADFIGAVKVVMINHGDDTIELRKGDRIAQLILERCGSGALIEVSSLENTGRGTDGLGSTGR